MTERESYIDIYVNLYTPFSPNIEIIMTIKQY